MIWLSLAIIMQKSQRPRNNFKTSMRWKFLVTSPSILMLSLVTLTKGLSGINILMLNNFLMTKACKISGLSTLPYVMAGFVTQSVTNTAHVEITEYHKIISRMMFLTNTRPDLTYFVGILARFLSQPDQQQLMLWNISSNISRKLSILVSITN